MEYKEMKKPIPVELDDDVLEKIGGGMVHVPLNYNTDLSPSTLTKNVVQEKTGYTFSRNTANIPAFPGTQTTPQIPEGLDTDIANLADPRVEGAKVREQVSLEELATKWINGNL